MGKKKCGIPALDGSGPESSLLTWNAAFEKSFGLGLSFLMWKWDSKTHLTKLL